MKPNGKWNHLIGAVGVPGSGKTTWAAARAMELGRASYVLAHDPGWRIPDTLPNGKSTGIKRHESIEEARAALAKDPKGIHAIAVADSMEVINFGGEVAAASLEANKGIPVTVLMDEAVASSDADTYRLGPELRQFIALRRHKNVGLIYTGQSPEFFHKALLTQSTELAIFRLRFGFDRLETLGFTPDEITKIKNLPNYQFVFKRLG